jgi:hypothetical protein
MARGSLAARSSPSIFVILSAGAFLRSRAPSAQHLDDPLEDRASEVHPQQPEEDARTQIDDYGDKHALDGDHNHPRQRSLEARTRICHYKFATI